MNPPIKIIPREVKKEEEKNLFFFQKIHHSDPNPLNEKSFLNPNLKRPLKLTRGLKFKTKLKKL